MIREVEVEKICIIYGASDAGNASTTKTHLEGGAVDTEQRKSKDEKMEHRSEVGKMKV